MEPERARRALEHAGRALAGADWIAPLAAAVGADRRALARWYSGRLPAPADLGARLAAALEARAEELAQLAARIRAGAPLPPASPRPGEGRETGAPDGRP